MCTVCSQLEARQGSNADCCSEDPVQWCFDIAEHLHVWSRKDAVSQQCVDHGLHNLELDKKHGIICSVMYDTSCQQCCHNGVSTTGA